MFKEKGILGNKGQMKRAEPNEEAL